MTEETLLRSRRARTAVLAGVAASVLLSSIFVASPATAVPNTREDSGFTFEIHDAEGIPGEENYIDDYAVVTGYSGTATTLVIPENFPRLGDDENVNPDTGDLEGGWWDVRGIAGDIFTSNGTSITEVHVPKSVSHIAANAFNSMTSITAVYLPGAAPTLELNGDEKYPLGEADAVTVFWGPTGDAYPLDSNDRWYGYQTTQSTAVSVDGSRRATIGVEAGERSISLGDISFGGTPFSHTETTLSNQSDDGVSLVVDDSSGTGAGWQVVLEASDFLWDQRPSSADSAYRSIPRSNFAVMPGELSVLVGNTTEGVSAFTETNFESPVKLLSADKEFGEDTYTLPLSFDVLVPANTRAGSFTSTLTLTMSLAP
jgi:hypothetical protein